MVLIRDNFSCKICDSELFLEVHHITYYMNGESILGKEQDNLEWMVTLCATHHAMVHENIHHKWNPKNINRSPIIC